MSESDEKLTDLQILAKSLLAISDNMKVVAGRLEAVEQLSDERGVALRDMAARLALLEQHMDGVVQLSKSTFDMVAEVKVILQGGNDGRQQAAGAGR
jgi:hypothetical protein